MPGAHTELRYSDLGTLMLADIDRWKMQSLTIICCDVADGNRQATEMETDGVYKTTKISRSDAKRTFNTTSTVSFVPLASAN